MALSNMSPRERTIVIALGVIILIALLGIGVLAARLVRDNEPEVTAGAAPSVTVTAIAPPSPEAPPAAPPVVSGGEPVAVTRAEGVGPGAPALITAQALHPGRRYRIEIAAADGTSVEVNGNWSQAAVAGQGQPAAPQIEFFEGMTPYQIVVMSPVENPEMWSVSVSAGLKNILGPQVPLVITIWDVTEAE